jgi:hypothetical protein
MTNSLKVGRLKGRDFPAQRYRGHSSGLAVPQTVTSEEGVTGWEDSIKFLEGVRGNRGIIGSPENKLRMFFKVP